MSTIRGLAAICLTALVVLSYGPGSMVYLQPRKSPVAPVQACEGGLSSIPSPIHRGGARPQLGSNSIPGTTGPGVPWHVDSLLSQHGGEIDWAISDRFPASPNVARLAEACGWDASTSALTNPGCMKSMRFEARTSLAHTPAAVSPADLDIVIPTIRDLHFLEEWREFIEGYHLIFVQDGDPAKVLYIPAWADYELYNRDDIVGTLGERAWIISSRDASLRNFGFLVSKKKYIYTLDDDCLPATGPDGAKINALGLHVRNLVTNSTPYFFNTLYDPYADGSDFVRGYPYSLRAGVPTAISHGLWLNAPDYDAPTQLLKPAERNTHLHQAVVTVPHGVLYPMCSMNVAFNRELIGPAFMQGLMGTGQPWARYDDMFAGWASKKVADHLGLGVKSGAPYIRHNKASNPFVNLEKEYMGIFWQEDVIRWFSTVTLAGANAADAYRDLARQVKSLQRLSPYFERLSTAMLHWVDVWEEIQSGQLTPSPSQRSGHRRAYSLAPSLPPPRLTVRTPADANPCALVTVVRNEGYMLPIWIRYYSQFFPVGSMFVLDHLSTDGSTDLLPVNVVRLEGEAHFMPHEWLTQQVARVQGELLGSGFPCVLFAEVDELVAVDPLLHGNLSAFCSRFAQSPDTHLRAVGWEVVHHPVVRGGTEPDIEWDSGILSQRRHGLPYPHYNKPVLSKIQQKFQVGFHTCEGCRPDATDGLYLLHLHSFDYNFCMYRETRKHEASAAMIESDRDSGWGVHFSDANAQRCPMIQEITHTDLLPASLLSILL